MEIKNNIQSILNILEPHNCKLITVTKTHPPEIIQEAYDAGLRHFGENKVQELVDKKDQLPEDIKWHMIGHLQRNKVKYIAPFVHLIHSVDSLKLLKEIHKEGEKNDRIISCLLQVHIAEESSKFGFSEEELIEAIQSDVISTLGNIKICGLMGMATFTDNEEQVRMEFEKINRIFKSLSANILPANMEMKELSIGMSGDFEIALESGSTMVRVGSAIFGERTY